jgi:phospholipid-translocating ATPase
MTWSVVLGSTVLMLLWVVLYSFFPVSSLLPSNFVDEVSILFGTVSFWATVIVTVCICLGTSFFLHLFILLIVSLTSAPRFIVKYWKAVYYPLDKDLVRELWVEGNLKDQLGLKHHKARRNRSTSGSPLESAPIFNEVNNRSLSELENSHDPFDSTHRAEEAVRLP